MVVIFAFSTSHLEWNWEDIENGVKVGLLNLLSRISNRNKKGWKYSKKTDQNSKGYILAGEGIDNLNQILIVIVFKLCS